MVGRYLFGLSFLGSDEVQIFIMIGMTFLGAVVVSRRNMHLRMDVLVRYLPTFHPPFGINIFVAQSVLGLKLVMIYRGIIPFVIIYLIALALITYIPDISLIGVRYLLAKG